MKNRFYRTALFAGLFCCGAAMAFASDTNFNDTTNKPVSSNSPSFTGNVGFGTTTPVGAIAVMNGNVGIGTWVPMATLDINGSLQLEGSGNTYFTGNVGISSTSPGKALDVNGAARMTGFILTTSPNNGYVLTSDTNGNGTWQAAGGSSQWTTTNTNDVYETAGGNVGIGTTKTTTAALTVMNGNVGIGTWVPGNLFQVGNAAFYVQSGGNAKLGGNFYINDSNLLIWGAGDTSISGIGDGTSGDNMILATNGIAREYIDLNGNIGIGTTKTVGGLSIMNGNVGIGTWVPSAAFQVGNASSGNYLTIDSTGGLITSKALQINFAPLSLNSNALAVISNNNAGAGSGINIIGGGSTSSPLVLQSTNAAGTSDYIDLLTGNNGSNRTRITSSGNIGIGTTTPIGGLTVMNGNVGIGTWVPGAALQVNNTLNFTTEFNNGSKSTNFTINWANGNKQSVTLAGTNLVMTMIAPSGVGNYQLKIIQNGSGSQTINWASGVPVLKWPGGSAPTLTTTPTTGTDIINCYYDGSNYYCTDSLDFR